MKIPYFCCIGAELKRYAKDFDFMNQVYLYKVPTDDTIDEVFAQDYFKAISDTVLQDDILYVYETSEQILHVCRFDKANGHITAVPLASNVPELEPDRILVSDQDGKIAAGDLSLEYIKDTLSILHCTATLSSTVDTTTVVMLDELEAFANLDSRPSYKAAGALVIDANGNHGIIESVDTANETAVIVTTFAYNAVVKDSAETQVMQGGLQTPELETDSLIVNGAATFEEAPITNDTTTYQSAASDSLVRKEQVEEVVQDIKTSSLTFIGYVSTTAPDSNVYQLNKKDLWLNSATMPTSFPFAQANIKEWDGTAWVAHNQDYTPANFDFFRNINDSEGYYWFAGQWVVMSTDMSTTYFQLNPISGKWEIKSNVNFPGEPTTTTPATDDNSTKVATTEFTGKAITAAKEKVISNCITEIPQDIKLELNNGTLTLKAGSKVYVPNGAGVFNVVTIASDLTTTTNVDGIVFVNSTGTSIYTERLNSVYSGDSAPSASGIWYDTANNLVKYSSNGQSWSGQYSFPVGIVSASGGQITSIDQVFNGFGYIGSTVFALPGVKGLIPNGRNADGTLKNTAFTVSSVVTETTSLSGTNDLFLNASSISQVAAGTINYDSVDNYNKGSGFVSSYAIVGITITSSGTITSFTSKTAFHALDYNDSEYIAHNAMPSDKYIDLTLGVSGSTYTAPADGYFTYMDSASGAGVASLVNQSNGLANGINAPSSTWVRRVFLPAKRGDVIELRYESGGTNKVFRFVYANGAQ